MGYAVTIVIAILNNDWYFQILFYTQMSISLEYSYKIKIVNNVPPKCFYT